MVRDMTRSVSPGCVVVYPNREKATSKSTKSIVVLLLLASVALMLIVTIGGWSKLAGLKALDLIWCAVYLIVAYYVGARWSRGGGPGSTSPHSAATNVGPRSARAACTGHGSCWISRRWRRPGRSTP